VVAQATTTTLTPYVPFQLVKPNKEHTGFEVVQDTVSRILSLSSSFGSNKKIAIVSVVGPYHSGKSFLLNALVGKTNTFSVGPKTSPETMGLWICRTDITVNKNVEVWFVDSEGFFGPNVSETYDAKIFTIAMLLGDEFIYNTVKIIDSQSVQMLEMLARRAQLFRVKSSAKEDGQNFLTRLPHLTWVVEDFVQEGGQSSSGSSSHWLESYLSPSDSDSTTPYLKKIFPSITVKPLFLPATTRQALMDLSRVPFEKLTEEFRKDLGELKKIILENHLAKGNFRSPTELGQAVHFLANALNKGLFPELPSLWNSWRSQVIESSLKDSYELFDKTLGDKIDSIGAQDGIPNLDTFEQTCVVARDSTLHFFKELVRDFGEESVVLSGVESLDSQMKDRYAVSAKQYMDSVGQFVLEKMRLELARFLSDVNESVFHGGKKDLIEPTKLESELGTILQSRLTHFKSILTMFEKGAVHWYNEWDRVVIPSSRTLDVLGELTKELNSQIQSIKVENEKEIKKLISGAILVAVKSIDADLVDPTELLTLSELATFHNNTLTKSRNFFDREIGASTNRKWIREFNPSYNQGMGQIDSEVRAKLEKFMAHHESRLREWLHKQAKKSLVIYHDMKRTIETSLLPCEESILMAQHTKAVDALTDSMDNELGAAKFNDTDPYRETRSGLDEVVSTEYEKLSAKNIELWKIHSDEATQCGMEMNDKYTEENCPQGWFCVFKVWPSKHREISMDHLMDCFSKRKGIVPPRDIQERVFTSWYEKELAREASEVRNNMWVAGISLVVPLVWIAYIRYAA